MKEQTELALLKLALALLLTGIALSEWIQSSEARKAVVRAWLREALAQLFG